MRLLIILFLIVVLIFFCIMGLTRCSQYYQGPPSNHFDGKQFHNLVQIEPSSFWAFLRWQFSRRKITPWPTKVQQTVFAKPPMRVKGNDLLATYVGHASVLLQTENLNILTDPVWSERASPVTFAGPKRVTAPGIHFADLPKIDVVLISHNHYDHLDLSTISKIWNRDHPLIITPLGNDTIIHKHDSKIKVHALDWDNKIQINPKITVYLQAAQHWSSRYFFDRNKALWGAFVMATPGGNIYFAGDSGYGKHLKITQQKFGEFRLAILPIGSYKPRWFMHASHMDPTEAVTAFQDLHARYAIPIHYDTFRLGDENYGEAAKMLKFELEKAQSSNKNNQENLLNKFLILPVGTSWEVPARE